MSRSFHSPGEQRLLRELPFNEAALLIEFMETFDAHLVPSLEPVRAPKQGESEQQVMRLHGRVRHDDRG